MNPYARFIEGKDPLAVIKSTPARIARLISGLTPRQVTKRVNPEKWSIAEIIQHLADTEMVFAARCRWVAFEDNPALPAYDQDRWANGARREKETAAQSLERFRVIRESQVRLFKSLSPEDWERAGVHAERGRLTLRLFAETCGGHDINHLEQITALSAALR